MAFVAGLRAFMNVLNYRQMKFWIALLSHVIWIPRMKDALKIYDHLWPLLLLKSKIIFNCVCIYVCQHVLGEVLKLQHMTGCRRFFIS